MSRQTVSRWEAKEKENLPPTPPIREKEGTHTDTPRACVCEGFLVPTLDEVKAFAAANGIGADIAKDFHNYCDAMGWRHNGDMIYNWRAMLKSWQRARKRFAAQEQKLTAHIDAKTDERERKRERRTGSGQEDLLAHPEAASAPVQGMKSGHAKIFSLFRESRVRRGFGRCPKPLFASS